MAIILNIETATERCSVAIAQGSEILSLKESDESFSHAECLTQLIEQATVEAKVSIQQLNAIAISSGPGSYTGLRIGASTAKGIGYALDKPLIAVDTLQSLAVASIEKEGIKNALYVPMIDARRMEVYAAGYQDNGSITFDTRPIIIDPSSFSDVLKAEQSLVLSGNGSDKCIDVISHPNIIKSNVLCSAAHLVKLSYQLYEKKKFVDLAYFSPHYLKAPNITKAKNTL